MELSLTSDFQRKEDRSIDLAALKEITRFPRELAAFEDASGRVETRCATIEHEAALAVEGRAVYVTGRGRG